MSPLADAASILLASAGVCVLIGGAAVRALARAQCLSPLRYQDCPPLQAYQSSKAAVPTMGGLFVLGVGIAVAAVTGGLRQREGWLILAATLGLGTLGLCDDWLKFRRTNARGLPVAPKLLIALGIGAGVGIASGARAPATQSLVVPWMPHALEVGWLWVPLAMLVVAGCAHAVNLTDGMDGLAAGCVAIALIALGVAAWSSDPPSPVAVAWCASLAGACLGFLWFNGFPASVVLGDVGALGLGAALGTISLVTRTALVLFMVGGVFVAEALSVLLQVASYKWRNKRRIFRVAPLHHHFQLGGMSEPKVIVRFWIAGAILALLGLQSLGTLGEP